MRKYNIIKTILFEVINRLKHSYVFNYSNILVNTNYLCIIAVLN